MFGCSKAGGAAAHGGGGCVRIKFLGDVEIDQYSCMWRRYDNVGRLDVAMNDGRLLAVEIIDGVDNGCHDGHDLG